MSRFYNRDLAFKHLMEIDYAHRIISNLKYKSPKEISEKLPGRPSLTTVLNLWEKRTGIRWSERDYLKHQITIKDKKTINKAFKAKKRKKK